MTVEKKLSRIIITILKYFFLVFFSFWAVIPIVSCVITAFKTNEEYTNTNVMDMPKNWLDFDNFITAWQRADMTTAFKNTIIILVFVLLGAILVGSMLAYVLDRFKFPGNALIRTLFLFASLLPGVAMQVATYKIMYNLHFINHLYGYIIMSMGTDIISIYIFIQFFENISKSLDESAIIDGASYFTVYFKVLFPLLKPAIITVLVLKGVGTYNEYYNANLYLQDKTILRTVSTSLYTFTGPLGNQYNMICAGVLISILPALIIFILCQKQVYSGLTLGSVKG